MQLVFDVHPDPMWLVDEASGRILEVNAAAVEAYGYARERFLQLRERDLRVGALRSPGAGARPGSPQVGQHRRASGEVVAVELIRRPIQWAERVVELVVTRRLAPREACSRSDGRGRSVPGPAAAVRRAEQLEAIGQLTAGIAHEFNNLLAVVGGQAEYLCEELKNRPQLEQSARAVRHAAERGARLVSNLLAFARRQALAPQRVEPSRQLSQLESLLRRTLPVEIELEVVCVGEPWAIEVDPTGLESAVLNLALNGRDAMPGAGRLCIATASCTVGEDEARARRMPAGQYVRISVRDTGRGIDAERLQRVFEPFYTTRPFGEGSGMGLAMVHGFVKQSGGHVDIQSERGEGTTVRLYFPRATRPRPDPGPEAPPRPVAQAPAHILVVEDDEIVRRHVCRLVERLGYRVLQAASGPEALQLLESGEAVDLVFTDMVMPGGMSGAQLGEALAERWPDVRIVYTSGYPQSAIEGRGQIETGVDFLAKPYRAQQLEEKLRQVLGREE